jgi:hypothetical protein
VGEYFEAPLAFMTDVDAEKGHVGRESLTAEELAV